MAIVLALLESSGLLVVMTWVEAIGCDMATQLQGENLTVPPLPPGLALLPAV